MFQVGTFNASAGPRGRVRRASRCRENVRLDPYGVQGARRVPEIARDIRDADRSDYRHDHKSDGAHGTTDLRRGTGHG